MDLVPIPEWNTQGVIPPIDEHDPVSLSRSPYPVSLTEFIERFSISPQRIAILQGFLKYRSRLHAIGLTEGFQWLDGSFLEDTELIQDRPPNDLDVVTFFQLPAGQSDAHVIGADWFLFDPAQHEERKKTLKVDAYYTDLSMEPNEIVGWSVYWYSLMAHRRDSAWKGFIQVDLSPAEDEQALESLSTLLEEEGTL